MDARILLAAVAWIAADVLEILRDSVEISREGCLWAAGKLAGL